jgi:hypothetical protein
MSIGPLAATVAVYNNGTASVQKPAQLDVTGNLIVGKGLKTAKNLTTSTVVKASAGRVARVSVIVAGSTTGTINDVATTGGAATANEIAVIANTVGVYEIDMPCATGIVFVPGTGMTAVVSYS